MKKIVFIFGILFTSCTLFIFATESIAETVNIGAAVASLEKTISLYAEESYNEAMFQADLGISYSPKMADFSYLKAISAKKAGVATKYCLDYLLPALEKDKIWHRYNKEDAALLAASLNLALTKYSEALKFIDMLPFEMSDAQLIKVAALYGLSRRVEAENIVLSALDRHSFDQRFPKLFFIQEKDLKRTNYSRAIAKRILENLYVWKDREPFLLPLSVHFENDDKVNRRNLKIYREMHTHFLPSYTPEELFLVGETILSNINYGVLSDEASIRELFSLKVRLKDVVSGKNIVENAVYKTHILQLVKIIGNSESRELIKGMLSNYSGLVLEDENMDGILETVLYYKSGRPDVVAFDGDQCGYPEFVVECNFGIPKKVHIGETKDVLVYDEYPFVSSVQMKDAFFQMRPRTFKWQPFTLERLKLQLFSDAEKHRSFFVLTLNSTTPELKASSLMQVAAYKEQVIEDEVEREFYDRGEIISREKRIGGIIVSLVNYKNGIPALEKCDIDRDGYFEKLQEYDKKGKIKKISLDFNKDGVFEYTEVYEVNGVVKKEWIDEGVSNGKSFGKVLYTIFSPEASVVEWVHPLKGKAVKLFYEEDEPVGVEIEGFNFPVFKDENSKVYWFKRIPIIGATVAKILEEQFSKTESPIFSCMVEVSGGAVFAVKSAGNIFAEYVED